MFMQLGFRDGLFDTSVTIHQLLDADVVLISPRSKSSISMSGSLKKINSNSSFGRVEKLRL